jgi:hypothetical protein
MGIRKLGRGRGRCTFTGVLRKMDMNAGEQKLATDSYEA